MVTLRPFIATLAFALFVCQPALSQKASETPKKSRVQIQVPTDPSVPWLVNVGGRGYDNWALLSRTKLPERTHPSYPKNGKMKGPRTWLCHECHGWDYRGKDGAYGSGQHYTGIKGLREMQGRHPDDIFTIIRDGTHVYPKNLLPNTVAERIALFVSQGQYNAELVVDNKTKKPLRGDAPSGRPHYQNMCALCHGFDGRARNLGTAENPRYIGTLAQDDPLAFMHKLRNGEPGKPMVALITLPMKILEDILAYSQTLPRQ